MTHQFDIDVAKNIGIHQAILLNNLFFWIEKNRYNNQNFYGGMYWTYNSRKAFSEFVPLYVGKADYLLFSRYEEKKNNYNRKL